MAGSNALVSITGPQCCRAQSVVKKSISSSRFFICVVCLCFEIVSKTLLRFGFNSSTARPSVYLIYSRCGDKDLSGGLDLKLNRN